MTDLHVTKLRVASALIAGAFLGLNSTGAHAVPWTAANAQFEKVIRESAGNPMAGLTARQSIAAQLDRQPTEASTKREEERLKSKFAATMARAKRFVAKGEPKRLYRGPNGTKRMYIL